VFEIEAWGAYNAAMIGKVFWKNGALLPVAEGTVPVDDVNFAYGYGVYETLKLRGGILYFPEWHAERLFHSARVIGLEHGFTPDAVLRGLEDLVRANHIKDVNLKVLLLGHSGPGADLYLMLLAPLFPKRRDYREGAQALLFAGERQYPEAKSLNMLVSTIAFRLAMEKGAYDAILVNRDGHLTEGTRTNLFYTDGAEFYTPPAREILAGVTRRTVIAGIDKQGWKLTERPLGLAELQAGRFILDCGREKPLAGLFLTSTSTKIMPLSRVAASGTGAGDDVALDIPPVVRELMKAYEAWLERYRATQAPLVD
jgi:branched-subunit amino acid aminotransferase/4-amino-4-deoxychorismate lyase